MYLIEEKNQIIPIENILSFRGSCVLSILKYRNTSLFIKPLYLFHTFFIPKYNTFFIPKYKTENGDLLIPDLFTNIFIFKILSHKLIQD
jgi:hypothetical protein